MKHKTSELEGDLLDAAVMKCLRDPVTGNCFISGSGRFHEDWASAGQIIEQERPAFRPGGRDEAVADIMNERGVFVGIGPTYLVAFWRAYVVSKFGEEVELP
jgi:hypothetical protein